MTTTRHFRKLLETLYLLKNDYAGTIIGANACHVKDNGLFCVQLRYAVKALSNMLRVNT